MTQNGKTLKMEMKMNMNMNCNIITNFLKTK